MAVQASEIRLRVAALIVDARGVTLVRHAKAGRSYHLLPGGGVEVGETLTAALVREVREETGLVVEPREPVLISDSIAPDGSRHMVQVVFEADVVGGAVTDTPEDERVEAVESVAVEGLASLDLRPPLAEAVKEAIARGGDGPALYVSAPWRPE